MDRLINSFEEGRVLLINKPLYWTSFDVVRKVRNITQTKKVGHAGTLDPLATGLLIVCTGKFTKKINEFMAQEKEYTGTITIGTTTPTYDLESEPGDAKLYNHIRHDELDKAATYLTGAIMQIPPIHSAIKVNGKRVYELARQGIDVKLEPRQINILSFDITSVQLPLVYFKVICSTGTYIRSLAHDFGKHLGCGAHLSNLTRTRIGDYSLSSALSIGGLEQEIKSIRMDK